MRNKAFKLTIEKPCSQNWDTMESNMGERYCAQCSKNVIDLTNLSDIEILAVIKRTKGELCGRVTRKQLEQVFIQPGMSYNMSRIRKILAGILALSSTGSLVYSKNIEVPKELVLSKETTGSKTEPYIVPPDTLKNIFQGIVTGQDTHEPLAGATIIISGTNMGVSADMDGKFSFKIPSNQLKDSIHIEVSYIGYETKRLSVSKHDLISENAIVLSSIKDEEEVVVVGGAITLSPGPVLGGITYTTSRCEKKPRWRKRKQK